MMEEAGKSDGRRAPSKPPSLGSFGRGHDDLDDMRRLQFDADAGPHRRIGPVHPFVPGAVHLALQRHAVDIDDSRQYLAFVGSTKRKAFINSRQRFRTLLIHRRCDRVGRDRDGEYETVVDDRAAAARGETWKAADHGERVSFHRKNLFCKGTRWRLMQREGVDLVAGARIELCHQRIMPRDDAIGMAGQTLDGFPPRAHNANDIADRTRVAAMEIAVEM